MYVKNSIKLFSIFSTAQKLPKIFTKFFGKCKIFHKKIRKNKRKTFQSPIWNYRHLHNQNKLKSNQTILWQQETI